MPPPFPGMDPWLEDPVLWPDVHNRLIAAIADALSPSVAPRYYVALEERIEWEEPGVAVVGRADLAVVGASHLPGPAATPGSASSPAPTSTVTLPMPLHVRQTYLEVRSAVPGEVVTVIELLSPSNKARAAGRDAYLAKRMAVLASLTSLVEIDLLRRGERMPGVSAPAYAALVSRTWERPRADVWAIDLPDPLPALPIPLKQDEPEPALPLGTVLAALYDRARYDLRIDYGRPPHPPLDAAHEAWAGRLLRESGRRA